MMQGWFKVKEIPSYCGKVSERTVYTWFEKGLRRVKVGGVVLIKREWLDDFLMSFEADPKAEVDGIVDEVMKGI
jgi:hypothetical protein